jgi:cation transport protein ChaC
MANKPLWVFGYGSLMWSPGFAEAERLRARLSGYARTFCMRSVHHRGTDANPGLVLALDPTQDAVCEGVAFRVAPGQENQTLDYLRERELVSSAYLEEVLDLHLSDGRHVEAVCYVVDTDHVQYCGGLALQDQAEIIAQAVGGRGPNTEYLYNTHAHLQQLGIQDQALEWLTKHVQKLAAQNV